VACLTSRSFICWKSGAEDGGVEREVLGEDCFEREGCNNADAKLNLKAVG
jgi:hypothetical protein